ncbi:MAG: phage tail sheath C-terminal domain-containing protein, partial [Ideonella sp.]
ACFGAAPTALFSIEVHTDPTSSPIFEAGFAGHRKGYDLAHTPGVAGGRFLLHASMSLFFQNGGGPCYVVSVGSFADAPSASALLAGIEALRSEAEPTLLVVPDAVLLAQTDCIQVQQAMLGQCGDLRDRFAILDLHGGAHARNSPSGDPVASFRSAIGDGHLGFGAAYYPWLDTTLAPTSAITWQSFTDPANLADLLGTDPGNVPSKQLADALADLRLTDAQWSDRAIGAIQAQQHGGTPNQRPAHDQVEHGLALFRHSLDQQLRTLCPLFNTIVGQATRQLNRLPPGAAMAGVYARVDNERGVWKAPANVGVSAVQAPAVAISQNEQDDLNVALDGKSINAIRSFIGQGTLVWGARTLDGNSFDWRYVNVRRTMMMIEVSCRLAIQAYAFEPNEALTWVTIQSMLNSFLTELWKAGALAGPTPREAFAVHVGLGQTMTAADLQQGLLRVSVMVAISRPAEFITISLQQRMQAS